MVVKKSVFELWSTIKETLSTPDLKMLTFLLKDFKHHRIEKTLLIASSQLLFKNKMFLHRWFTDVLNDIKPQEEEQEDEDRETQKFKTVSKKLSHQSELQKLVSSFKELDKQKISHIKFLNKGQEDEQDVEEGKIREERLLRDTKVGQTESNRLAARAEKSKEDVIYHCDSKFGRNVGIEAPEDRESDKMNLEGKKRIILHQEPILRSPQKPRTSRLLQPVTLSYKLIPEEEQSPVSNPVLNNRCSLKNSGDELGLRTLTNYEAEMARCEEDMYEAEMLMETMKIAVEKANKVIRKVMRVEDLGVKFFRCIKWLYDRDMCEIVTQHHDQMFPVLSCRSQLPDDNGTLSGRKSLKKTLHKPT